MNTRRTIGQRREGEGAGDNQVPPQVPVEGVAMPVNPGGLIDVEVRESLVQMVQDITMHTQDMTNQVNRHNVQRDNPLVCSMADRLRDFTRINPPIFTGSKTLEDPLDFVDEVHTILVAMGSTDN